MTPSNSEMVWPVAQSVARYKELEWQRWGKRGFAVLYVLLLEHVRKNKDKKLITKTRAGEGEAQ